MKTAARNIVRDLVDTRLWPVAVALLVSIVAAPLILARGGAPASGPAASAAPRPATNAPTIALAEAGAGFRERGGRVRNPFGTAAEAASAPAGSATTASGAVPSAPASSGSSSSGASTSPVAVHAAPATGASTSSPSASPSTGAGSATGTASPTPAGKATTSAPTTEKTSAKTGTSVTYSVTLRFGRTEGTRRTLRDIARLTALPDAKAPVASLVGVLRDGRTAVVKVAAEATAAGNGACKPSASKCTTVEMRAGDAEYFRVAGPDGQAAAWYYLKVLHVDRHETTSKAVAAAAYARRSAAGMEVLRREGASVRAYRYLPGLGVLVRAQRRTAPAAKTAGAGVDPLLPADRQRGVAAWRSVPRAAKR